MKISELLFDRDTTQVRCSCGAVWDRTGLIAVETRDDARAKRRFIKQHGSHEVAGIKCISIIEAGK